MKIDRHFDKGELTEKNSSIGRLTHTRECAGHAPADLIQVDLDRQRNPEDAAVDISDLHPVPWLHHAEFDPLAVQDDRAADRYIKGQPFAVHEHGHLSVDRIDTVNYPDAD